MRQLLQSTSIVKKMTGALWIMVLLALLLSGFAVHKLSSINSHTVAMQDNWLVSIKVLGQVKGLLAEGKYNVVSHLQSSSTMGANRVENKFRTDEEALQRLWKSYLQTSHDSTEAPLSRQFFNDYEAFLNTVGDVLTLSRNNQKEEARILFLNTTLPSIIEAQASLERLIEYHSNRANDTVQHANTIYQQAWKQIVGLFVLISLCSYGLLHLIQRVLLQPVIRQTRTLSLLAHGDSQATVSDTQRHDEIGDMARALNQLKVSVAQQQQAAWIKTHTANLTSALQNQASVTAYAQQLLSTLAPLLDAQVATLYYQAPNQSGFEFMGGYCLPARHPSHVIFELGEGLIGQCALNQQAMYIRSLPEHYLETESATMRVPAKELHLIPIVFPNERVAAVIELAFLNTIHPQGALLLDEILPRISLQLKILERQHLATA
jgi:HAMP domain-containing protein